MPLYITKNLLASVSLTISAIATLLACLLLTSGNLPLTNVYDAPLYALQALYTAHGLVPYQDFGFIYPPLTALVFGQLLHITEAQHFFRLVWLTVFVLLCANSFLLARLLRGTRGLIGAALLLLLTAQPMLALFYTHGVEPFSLPLLVMSMLLTISYLRQPQLLTLSLLSLCALLLALTRCDRAIAVTGLTLGFAVVAWLVARTMYAKNETGLAVKAHAILLGRCGVALLAGLAAGLALLFLYGWANGTLAAMRLFIFQLPYAAYAYRALPLPHFASLWNADNLFYAAIAGLSLLLVTALCAVRKHSLALVGVECLALLAAPLALLPYAFGRSDYAHFVPLAALVIAALVLAPMLWRNRAGLVLAIGGLVLLALPLATVLKPFYGAYMPGTGNYNARLQEVTGDCAKLVPSNAQSIFVGRTSYAHFIYNQLILYMAFPQLKPATRFLAEDPGVQNSCTYGAMIAADLHNAPQPMVAFLITNPQSAEPNATTTMTSCGKIEAALAAPSRLLGTCHIGIDVAEVRIYGEKSPP